MLIIAVQLNRSEFAKEATTKGTKSTKNCNFRGNSSRGYALESRGVFPLKKRVGDRGLDQCAMHFVPSVCFVVASPSID
jgi:hypothetical protein